MGHSAKHSHYRHVHSEDEQKAVLNRMSRAIGHLESIKRMIEDDRDCSEVLTQLSAVRSAITNISKIIMRHHMEHCIVDAVQNDELERVEDLKKAIERFIK
ncbi:MAG: metal-sensing transcriptional repressor [Synergistaceae bacterium]|jgi:DNA-binding FrmR family transcriptional regulator|nr:metal-sensing transcriptional repressor [Synergistaceae bacterium]